MATNKQVGFILSTGRTGTMFFEDYINQTSKKAKCFHEPKPSRKFIPLTNMYHQGKITSKKFNEVYFNNRAKIFHTFPQPLYIESSNFMWASVFSLNETTENIKVLHIVRHPQDYIHSHYQHGFWKFSKRIIRKYVPYFVADLPLSRQEKKDPLLVLAARWKLINETLEKYAISNSYLLVKFENIFHSSTESGIEELNKIRAFFDLENLTNEEHDLWLKKKKNPSKKISELDDKKISNFCENHLSDLMKKYNYQIQS